MEISAIKANGTVAVTFLHHELYQLAALLQKPADAPSGQFLANSLAQFFLSTGIMVDAYAEAPEALRCHIMETFYDEPGNTAFDLYNHPKQGAHQ